MRAPKRLDCEGLWAFALKLLGARAQSVGELRQKLLRRAERAEDVPEIVARLKERGYLDDQRFAETFSAARLENQGLGKARVIRDLRNKRVAPGLAEKTVQDLYRDRDEIELVEQYVARKFRNVDLPVHLADPKKMAAAYRRLRMAGFSSGAVVRVLQRFAKEPEALDNLEDPEGDA